jgi:hypothetical protein
MPIKDLRAYCEKHGVKHGKYYVRNYESGGFFLYKPGWKRGLDVPSDERLVQRYNEQMQQGQIKESLKGQIAARAVPVCGHLSRDIGREVLGLPPINHGYGSKKDAKKAVHDYWRPRKSGSGFFRPTRNQDKRVSDFMDANTHLSEYKYIVRHLGSFKEAVDSWYPGLYRDISLRRTQENSSLSKAEMKQVLIERFNAGLTISASPLLHSQNPQERELYRRVLDLAETTLFGKKLKQPYTQIVNKLTGIPMNDIKLDNGANTHCGKLTEYLTSFLFYWSSLLDLETWNIDSHQWISTKRADLTLFPEGRKIEGEQDYEADLRVGNLPIEVKTGVARFSENRRDDIIKKYGNHGIWATGEPIEKGAVIFHAQPELCDHFLPDIKKASLRVISYNDFHNNLQALIAQMKTKPTMYRDVRPIANLDYLLDLHEEVSMHPFLLVRSANNFRREWYQEILHALISRAQELRDKKFGRMK